MPNGYGRGFGRGGRGFRFRGSSPPWPYVGRGRGGLPRCEYYLSGAAGPVPPAYSAQGVPRTEGQAYPYDYQMSREEELEFLRHQAEGIKGELEQIDARIKELEAE